MRLYLVKYKTHNARGDTFNHSAGYWDTRAQAEARAQELRARGREHIEIEECEVTESAF